MLKLIGLLPTESNNLILKCYGYFTCFGIFTLAYPMVNGFNIEWNTFLTISFHSKDSLCS